jgi:tetratricopeptide (TPR) repeat protein
MKYKLLRLNILTFLFLIITAVVGQRSVYYNEPDVTYKRALELFRKQTYGPSEKMFDKVIKEYGDNKENVFVEDAYYFSLVCSVELQEGNALSKAELFVKMYPESVHIPSVWFYMGKLYFDNKKYRQALQVFEKVNPSKLTSEQRDEYYYKKGFGYLKINKPDDALPLFEKVMKAENPFTNSAKYYFAHIKYLKKDYDTALKLFEELKGVRKYKKYVNEYLIHIYYEKKQYDEVIKTGLEILPKAKSRSKGEIARLIANSYYELENYDKALEYYNIFEKYGRKISPEDNYKIGVVKYKAGLYGKAIGNFERATKLKNEIGQSAWYYLGFCYLNTQQDKFARDSFLKAYRMNGNDEISTDALFNYVKATIKTGGDPYNDEIKILESFIDNNPGSPRINEAYDLLVQLFITSKDFMEALNSLEKIKDPDVNLQKIYQNLAYRKAIEVFRRSNFKGALVLFNKALKYTPDKHTYTMTLYWKAETLYRMKRYGEAIELYKDFLKRKDALDTKFYSTALYNLGYAAFNQKDYELAINYFSKFLNYSNVSEKLKMDAQLRIADIYFLQKNYPKAIEFYDKVINSGGIDSDYALFQKASCYGAQSNFNLKINVLNQLVSNYKSSPYYTDALFEIGSTYLVINDQRHAISSFNRVVREFPKSAYAKKALMKTGLLYYGNNQNDLAVKVFKQVIKKYPASFEATEALNTLKNIYTESGEVDKYIEYAKKLDFVQVSTSEEDSLTFVAGENYYVAGNCDAAINALLKYTNKFPKGGFVIKSYYYIADCYLKKQELNKALVYFEKIIEFPDNEYTLKSLLLAARISFDNNNYEKAYEYYTNLRVLSETPSLTLEAVDGIMRSAFFLKKYNKAYQNAHEILTNEKVTQDQIVFAHYIIAKTAYQKGNIKEAEKEFSITDKLTSGEQGAESKYFLAKIAFDNNKNDEAENIIYQLSDNYPDFPYWVAKGFILLADIYVERGNNFQAEQTLKSIIDNYNGDDLKKIANEKLRKIKASEAKNIEVKEGGDD